MDGWNSSEILRCTDRGFCFVRALLRYDLDNYFCSSGRVRDDGQHLLFSERARRPRRTCSKSQVSHCAAGSVTVGVAPLNARNDDSAGITTTTFALAGTGDFGRSSREVRFCHGVLSTSCSDTTCAMGARSGQLDTNEATPSTSKTPSVAILSPIVRHIFVGSSGIEEARGNVGEDGVEPTWTRDRQAAGQWLQPSCLRVGAEFMREPLKFRFALSGRTCRSNKWGHFGIRQGWTQIRRWRFMAREPAGGLNISGAPHIFSSQWRVDSPMSPTSSEGNDQVP